MAKVLETEISGVWLVEPEAFGDERGRFVETYRRSWIPGAREMVQANRSDKQADALVGLHFHPDQSDYWTVAQGRVQVVLHDLRLGSPTEHRTASFELNDAACKGVYIPPGVAHGFAALTDATLTYLVDSYYDTDQELGVAWDDPEIAAPWQVDKPVVSKRDQGNPSRRDLGAVLPTWAE